MTQVGIEGVEGRIGRWFGLLVGAAFRGLTQRGLGRRRGFELGVVTAAIRQVISRKRELYIDTAEFSIVILIRGRVGEGV